MSIFEIDSVIFFLLLLPLVAFLYASVGHGGASGYLALMALFAFEPSSMKPTALLLNLFVAAISFFHYWRNGHFNLRLFTVFAISSIPFAYLGGLIELDASIYKRILAILLIIAILRMLNIFGKKSDQIVPVKRWQGLIIGAVIGFFSGLIGIGGGIILTPVILLMDWGEMKEAAAVSALFIWVNSAAGMLGQISSGVTIYADASVMVGIAVAGGFFGAYFGSTHFNNRILRYLLAFVLLLASVKLIFT
ncbi:MAG: sulfite exporter TauE/SafE family protein [Calditrichaeota bacterium]|nr:sulfite exporter TauE/SafE family protein [Calditrichota bacterium]